MPNNPVAMPLPPISYLQDPATYKAILDGNAAVAQRLGAAFAPFASPTPDMTVKVGPGAVLSGATLTNMGTLTAGTTTSASADVTLTGPLEGIANGMAVIGIPTTTINIIGTTTNGSASVTGITTGTSSAWVGAGVSGAGISPGTTVSAVGAGTITLSANATASGSSALLIQGQNPIPAGTTVSSITGTTLTMSTPATASVTGLQIMVCQTSGTITAPVSNSRIDRGVIDPTTGALTIVTGTPGASPTAPAIPAGKIPCFQVRIASTDTYISNSAITDERVGASGGAMGGFGTRTDIASATTTDIGTIASHYPNITGTTTITGFGSSADANLPLYLIRFNAALTLTNGAALAIPGGANITTAAGDHALAVYTGSGNWVVLAYWYASGAVVCAALTANGAATLASTVATTGIISPSQLTANTDNWNPTGLSSASVIRVSTDASRNLTGLQGGASGRYIRLMNIGSNALVLMHDATSTAANRFYCPGGSSFTLAANTACDLFYDATSSRWRVVNVASAGAQYFIIEDQKSSGTAGGGFTSGAWRTRDLNTSVLNEITGASLGTNQFTLPAGTFEIYASCPSTFSQAHAAKLYNVTDATDTVVGNNHSSSNASGSPVATGTNATIVGKFTLAGSKTFEIQHRCQATRGGDGFGLATSFGTERYTFVMIKKIG